MTRPFVGEAMPFRSVVVILGTSNPLFVLFSSSIELGWGLPVPIPTACEKSKLPWTMHSSSDIQYFIIFPGLNMQWIRVIDLHVYRSRVVMKLMQGVWLPLFYRR